MVKTKYSEIKAIRTNERVLHSCRNKDINKFKLNINNTLDHELVKFLIFYKLRLQNKRVVVEGIFTNNLRADVVDLTDNVIYEVVNTESEASIIKKRTDYPFYIHVVNVSYFKDSLDLLKNILGGLKI